MSIKRPADEAAEGPAKKNQSFTVGTSIITLKVGSQEIEHLVHESILNRCPFFEKCLNSGMRERQEKSISLPEDDPEAISNLVDWLYTETVCNDLTDSAFVQYYVAADKFGLPELQNALMDQFRVKLGKDWLNLNVAKPDWASDIWKRTSHGCKLREFALDALHFSMMTDSGYYEGPRARYHNEFQEALDNKELRLALVWRCAHNLTVSPRNPCVSKKLGKCEYHVHKVGEKC